MNTVSPPISEADDYDEFGFLEAVAREWDVPWTSPRVIRREVEVGSGQTLSALVWGETPPELVFLHGGGQNAHTWDALALMLGRPMAALDLPGHGHAAWRPDHDYRPQTNAKAVAVAMAQLAPQARAVVGMSLGGATTIRLAAEHPGLVRKAVIIDVTPNAKDRVRAMSRADKGTVALVGEAPSYPSYQAMADAAVALSPYRSAQGVRFGVRHNARRMPDGSWRWRYDALNLGPQGPHDVADLWTDVSRITQPAMLVLGGESRYVAEADAAEMLRRKPDLRVETVPGAGHAVQSDRPVDLARLIEDFVF